MMGKALIPPVLKAKSFSQGHRGEIEKGGMNGYMPGMGKGRERLRDYS